MKEILKKSNYKAILHSKRANIYYLEKCRVMQKDGRVVYLTESSDENFILEYSCCQYDGHSFEAAHP